MLYPWFDIDYNLTIKSFFFINEKIINFHLGTIKKNSYLFLFKNLF